jgi:hypothetical protein
MNFENFDKSHENEDDGYGHYCNLENNDINEYHQKVFFFNSYAILTNNDKPSLYSIDYYYYPDVPNNNYVKLKTLKYEVEKKENPQENKEENKYKKNIQKFPVTCMEIFMFSMFISTIYFIVKMN